MKPVMLLCAVLLVGSPAEARQWTIEGMATPLDAELVGVGRGQVALRRSGNEIEFVRYDDLSAGDRAFIAFSDESLPELPAAPVRAAKTSQVELPFAMPVPGQPLLKPASFKFAQAPVTVIEQIPSPGMPSHPHHHCCPKVIFYGCKTTIHLIGCEGTISYMLGCQLYLARLKPKHCPTPDCYCHFCPECGDCETIEWAIGKFKNCAGCSPLWRKTCQGWCLYDWVHCVTPR